MAFKEALAGIDLSVFGGLRGRTFDRDAVIESGRRSTAGELLLEQAQEYGVKQGAYLLTGGRDMIPVIPVARRFFVPFIDFQHSNSNRTEGLISSVEDLVHVLGRYHYRFVHGVPIAVISDPLSVDIADRMRDMSAVHELRVEPIDVLRLERQIRGVEQAVGWHSAGFQSMSAPTQAELLSEVQR